MVGYVHKYVHKSWILKSKLNVEQYQEDTRTTDVVKVWTSEDILDLQARIKHAVDFAECQESLDREDMMQQLREDLEILFEKLKGGDVLLF